MSEAIGVRLEEEMIHNLDELSKEEALDRSTLLRKLLKLGFLDYMKQKAKEKYLAGRITISEGARMANCTLWEFQRYLVEQGYVSSYSITNLEQDRKLLRKL